MLLWIGLTTQVLQAQVNFHYFDSVPVLKNGDTLLLAFAGGLNNPQFSDLDLDRDGKPDLFVFDGSSNTFKTFLNKGAVGEVRYQYAPQYISKFPQGLNSFVHLKDYNCDGEPDLYSQASGGILLHRNDYLNTGDLSFTQITPNYIVSDYGLPFMVNIWNSASDIPGIDDVDQDGDVDLVVFPLSSNSLELHQNKATQINDCDSLAYSWITSCWGHFYENALDNGIVLNYNCKGGPDIPDSVLHDAHSGSTLLLVDLDKDGDKDVLLGDISFGNMVAVINGGDVNTANMVSYDSLFPSYDTPVDFIYPVAFYLDIDNDQVKDIVVSSNAPGVSNNYQSAWFYKNNGQTDSLVLHLEQTNLLQDEMIEVGEGAYPVFFDYNVDGLKDLVIGNYGYYSPSGIYQSKLTLYENTGTLNDPVFEYVTDDYANLSSLNLQGIYPAFGDLDGDGDQDLMMGDYSGRLHYLENTAGASNEANFVINALNYQSIDIGDYATPQVVDVNGDNLLDLIVGEMSGTINYFENTGTSLSPIFSTTPTDNKLGDIDVSPLCCTGYSVPYMTKDSAHNRVLYVASEYGKIYYFENIDGNVTGTFTKSDSIMNVTGRIAVSGANILGQSDEELVVGSILGGVSLLKSGEDLYVSNQPYLPLNQSVQIFPNPIQDELFVSSNIDQIVTVKLYDLLGQMLISEKMFKKNSVLHTKNLNSGVYILSIENKYEQIQYKVVKP